jgi:hypothetical protein
VGEFPFGADGFGVGGVGEEEGAGEYDRGKRDANLHEDSFAVMS